jgi:uncharacterized membrane protein YeaQ/YmgE (transglycosylase-associated protein family)
MYTAHATANPDLIRDAVELGQLVAVAVGFGWVAERLLDTEVSARGTAFLCGIAGLYSGSWIFAEAGWFRGPAIAGQALIPGFVGALIVAGVLKMVGLAVAGPRR